MHLPLIRNASRAVLTLNDNRAPKGCLLDANLHAFFNYRGILDSHYNLMSVCSIQAKEGVAPSSISLDISSILRHAALQSCTHCQLHSKRLSVPADITLQF